MSVSETIYHGDWGGTELIIGLDMSRYQGRLNQTIVTKMVKAGVKFAGIKFSQGTGWKDPEAENSTRLLQSVGVKVFPYHFVTTADGNAQYEWFEKCMVAFQFDLPPMMDCEYYTAASPSSVVTANGLGLVEPEVQVVEEFRYGSVPLSKRLGRIFGAYYIPTEKTVDIIGVRLISWMGGQHKLKGLFNYPSIYTNVSSGNAIFRSPMMSRYNLMVANWRVLVPNLPAIWKAQNRYIIWQDNVVPGQPYGLVTNVDHDIWGNQFPFPSETPTPPDPPEPTDPEYLDLTGTSKSGKLFAGRMTEIK